MFPYIYTDVNKLCINQVKCLAEGGGGLGQGEGQSGLVGTSARMISAPLAPSSIRANLSPRVVNGGLHPTAAHSQGAVMASSLVCGGKGTRRLELG